MLTKKSQFHCFTKLTVRSSHFFSVYPDSVHKISPFGVFSVLDLLASTFKRPFVPQKYLLFREIMPQGDELCNKWEEFNTVFSTTNLEPSVFSCSPLCSKHKIIVLTGDFCEDDFFFI